MPPRNRPGGAESTCRAERGGRTRRFRAVFCPSGVLRSSAVSVSAINRPESIEATIPRRGNASADPGKPWADRRHLAKGRIQQKGPLYPALFSLLSPSRFPHILFR